MICCQILSARVQRACVSDCRLCGKLSSELVRLQAAYQDEEAANAALQAVAPIGLKLLRHEALHLQ